jgi:hypothetical protein
LAKYTHLAKNNFHAFDYTRIWPKTRIWYKIKIYAFGQMRPTGQMTLLAVLYFKLVLKTNKRPKKQEKQVVQGNGHDIIITLLGRRQHLPVLLVNALSSVK